MKSAREISGRLEKLRARSLRHYCAQLRGKKPQNCAHNYEHVPLPSERNRAAPIEAELAPRVVRTLVIIQPDAPIRLCMYGADDPSEWEGTICDRDEVAQQCKLFSPKVSEQEALDQFNALMADDKYVYDNHKDIAALQWVLGERVHSKFLSWWDRMLLRIDSAAYAVTKFRLARRLPEHEALPDGMWTDADAENLGKRSPPLQK